MMEDLEAEQAINNSQYSGLLDADKPVSGYETGTGKQSYLGACVSLMKAVLGSGSFFIPFGLYQGGGWASVLVLILLSIPCAYHMVLVIRVKRTLDWSGDHATYPTLVEKVFVNQGYGKHAQTARWFAWTMILLSVIGACAVYLQFCSKLIQSLYPKTSLTTHELEAIFAGILIPLSLPRSIKFLSFASLAGDACLLLAMFVTIYYGVAYSEHYETVCPIPWSKIQFFHASGFMSFIGLVVFLYAIVILALPLEQSLQRPDEFKKAVYTAFGFITVGNALFCFFAFRQYGPLLKDIVLDNIQGRWGDVAKWALIGDVLVTYLVLAVAARELIEPIFVSSRKPHKELRRAAVRIGIVVSSLLLTFPFKNIDDLVNVISGITSTFTAFVVPASLGLLTFRNTQPRIVSLIQGVTIVGALAVGAYITVMSMENVIQAYEHPHQNDTTPVCPYMKS